MRPQPLRSRRLGQSLIVGDDHTDLIAYDQRGREVERVEAPKLGGTQGDR
jgi:hypothetical protein